jgi:hypothetical protein
MRIGRRTVFAVTGDKCPANPQQKEFIMEREEDLKLVDLGDAAVETKQSGGTGDDNPIDPSHAPL